METSKPLSFQLLGNDYLENILLQLVNRYSIVQMFYNKQKSAAESHLVIHLRQKRDADDLRLTKWVKKVKELYDVNVYCFYSARLHRQFVLGFPFVEWLCRPSAVIYQNDAAGDPLLIKRSWKEYKNKFYDYEERFYNDHERQLELLQKLIAEGSVNSVFTAYERLMDYDLDYLEELHSGNRCESLSLNERINNLIAYVPDIQKYFVKKNGNSYYLMELFAKAKSGIKEEEVIFDDDMYEAVAITEKGLYALIEDRCLKLKKSIKKACFEKHELPIAKKNPQEDAIVGIAITTILQSVEVEQIYWFHQSIYGEKKTYYLLLIGRFSNDKLASVAQSLKSKTTAGCDFVLIGHERYWIQKNLSQYQEFFFRIIQDENLIYSSGDCHAELHWKNPYESNHGDLYLYCQSCQQSMKQFYLLANNQQNTTGVAYLFTLVFLSFCRYYIYAKTYYIPNTLSCRALWQLCVYANPEVYKYQHALEQFPGDLFGFLDKHLVLHNRLSKLSQEELDEMKVIVGQLEVEVEVAALRSQ